MTHTEFCYWLQGFFELNPYVDKLTDEQIRLIRVNLDKTFVNLTRNKESNISISKIINDKITGEMINGGRLYC